MPVRSQTIVWKLRSASSRPWVLEDVAQHDARRQGAVVAQADERLERPVLRRDRAQSTECGRLADRLRQRERLLRADAGRNHGIDQRGARAEAEEREHRGLVGRGAAEVARDELVVAHERRERLAQGNGAGRHRGSAGRVRHRVAAPRHGGADARGKRRVQAIVAW
jgi:hypothetical protein